MDREIVVYIKHTVEMLSDEISHLATIWLELDVIISDISQKDKYVILIMYYIKKLKYIMANENKPVHSENNKSFQVGGGE